AEQTDDRTRGTADALAPEGADRRVMVCPVCGYENLQGNDLCANCEADLASSDIPQATSPFERLLVEVPLSAVETRPPVTFAPSDPVSAALTAMRDRSTACVLIVDGGRLVGLFTEHDAVSRLLSDAGSGSAIAGPIADVMTADPVVLRATDSVAIAIQKMAVGGFRHIPLVADGRPIGIVSAADVFRHVLRIVE
ncbi:MAG TPA: CBS domain-containing protein, partial [Candidatus Saccharimonadales bacterium]|nr:CBS domain-containing protein [Candidatus Saccharimonadales bacterium]